MSAHKVTLEDKYKLEHGQAFMTGIQALVRMPLDQKRRDVARGMKTAGYITGYRGSPLGGYDQQLSKASAYLDGADIVFQEGINEDLAATAVWGSQQTALFPDAKYEGVFSIWYGKAPGVDRSGDVFKHANFSGVAPLGGVVAILGDDPTCKSSTLPSQSEYAMMDCEIPVFNPSSVQEVLDYGYYALELSRFAGCWTSMIALADTMDGGAVVNVDIDRLEIKLPNIKNLTAERYIKRKEGRMIKEVIHREQRMPAAMEFVRANKLDKQVMGGKKRKIGIVTTGRAYQDVHEALDGIGLGQKEAENLGLTIFKVAMTWPLEPSAVTEFCKGLDAVLVVEHKRPLIEDQLKTVLYDLPAKQQPIIYGKRYKKTTAFPDTYVIPVPDIARAILDLIPEAKHPKQAKLYFEAIAKSARKSAARKVGNIRAPFFCSGCPHNTSTKLPEGARALAGIGCHFLASIHNADTDMHTQMGGEGVPWVGMAPFTDTPHIFANLGDGTYSHSGSLAIRAAVAGKVNITYKLLYNDAVAMTGGQTPELSGRSVPHIVTQLQAEAVSKIIVVADDLDRYAGVSLPTGVELEHRDDLMAVQERLQSVKGVSVLVYDQTCATEKRRRRKRGKMAQAPARAFINKSVCENCGDCSVQSSCLSVEPTWTEMGLKRVINQSSCNQDLSCVKGFCPSFVSVYGGQIKEKGQALSEISAGDIPGPRIKKIEDTYNMVVTGIGGAGVTTISALLGMAAHIDGHAANTLDSVGLAQKGGAVTSQIRLASHAAHLRSGSVPLASADIILGGDVIVTHDADVMSLMGQDRTQLVMNTEIVPTAEYLGSRDLAYSKQDMIEDITRSTLAIHTLNAQILAEQFMGDAIYANMIVMGAAWQKGYIPITQEALEQAIRLNGTKVEANLAAFDLGRIWCVRPESLQSRLPKDRSARNPRIAALEDVIAHRRDHLSAYQNTAYAKRYTDLIERVRRAEAALNLPQNKDMRLTRETAIQYARLLAYKDEYEIGRLYTDQEFTRQISEQFSEGYKIKYHLAPPILGQRDKITGHLRKREFGAWVRPLFKVLASLKGLRGTVFDVFGYTAERRMERRLISDFENRIETILVGLDKTNHESRVKIIGAVDEIRGFGHVKEEAVKEVEARLDTLTLG